MTYIDALHPRGQAANAGQFRAKQNTPQTGTLEQVGPSNEDIAAEIAQSYGSYRTLTEGLAAGEVDADGIRAMLQRIGGAPEATRIIDENYGDFETFHAAVGEGDVDSDGVSAMVGTAMRARLAPAPHAREGVPNADADALHNAEIESYYRQGDREISDTAATTIARDILHNLPDGVPTTPDAYPHLRNVASGAQVDPTDHAAVDAIHKELSALYKRGTGSGSWANRDRRIDSMFTWALHGGDNSR